MHRAARWGRSAAVQALLDGKADIEARDKVRMRAGVRGRGCGWVGVVMH